jgi:hypothetical protein
VPTVTAMDIQKSTRHQAIVGMFGEYLVANWLSRSGFEVCRVDHTGIDLVAYSPSLGRRLGVTVKSRTRSIGAEATSVTLFRAAQHDRDKVVEACHAFDCGPWIAVYVETANYGNLYLTSLENYDRRYKSSRATAQDAWKMGRKHLSAYDADNEVRHIRINFSATRWWTIGGLDSSGLV